MGSSVGRSVGRILVLVGLFELALAAGFWFILGDMPAAGEGMRLTAGILGLTGVVLLVIGLVAMRRATATDRVSREGIAGTADIVGLRQTGMFVNNNPQVELDLQVQVIGRSPYRTKVKEVVPLVMLNRLHGTVPIRVDPTDPERVVIQWALAGSGGAAGDGFGGPGSGFGGPGSGFGGPGAGADESLGMVAAAMGASGAADAAPVFAQADQANVSIEQLRAHLRANGISGSARIDRLEDSGQTIGDERLFTMTTTVTVPGRATITSGPSAAMVPLEKVGRIAVGVVLPVKVAPDNDDLQMFEWDRI
jgi:hypothetical protein